MYALDPGAAKLRTDEQEAASRLRELSPEYELALWERVLSD